MLLSGLWKLAAMTGVIGVGLVAVYQAQQGLDKAVATSTEAAGERDENPMPDPDVQAVTSVDSDAETPDAGTAPDDSLFGTDPFGAGPATTRSALKQVSQPAPAAQPALAAPGGSPLEESGDPFNETPQVTPKATARTLSDSEHDRGETAETTVPVRPVPIRTGPDTSAPDKVEAADEPLTPIGDSKAARLPDDLDALEREVLEAAKRAGGKNLPSPGRLPVSAPAAEPVRQVGAEVDELNQPEPEPFAESQPAADTEKGAPSTDPFDEAAAPARPASPKPASAKPSADPVKPLADAPANADPFEENPKSGLPVVIPDPAVDLAEPEQTPKPEPGPKAPSDDLAEPLESKPMPSDKRPLTLPGDELNSPFGPSDGGLERAKPNPVAEPEPLQADPEPLADPEEVIPRSRPKASPKLPTVIPEPADSEFPGEPAAPGKRATPDEPATLADPAAPGELPGAPGEFPSSPPSVPARSPVPDSTSRTEPESVPVRRPAAPAPKPLENDLFGDGTVDGASPRGVQQARLTIEKIAPQQAILGEPVVYSVIIKNVGGADAHHVLVEDRIPKGTELTGTAPRAEMVEKRLIWRIGTLKANEEKKISIRVIPRQQGSVGSVAKVSFATEVAAEIMVAAPQLSFTAKAPRQVRIGETIELMFLLKNSGTAAATNVTVRDLVPAGLKHEAASDIECPIGRLAPNETREIVLSVTAVKPGRATNRAILTGDGGISQELESPIEVIGEQLVLTRSGQTKVYVDRPVQFTNNVKNDGNAEVKNVRVAEIVPAGMEFVEASDGGRFDPVQRSIYWELSALPPGAEAAVSSKLVARSPGAQQAKITATGPLGSTAAISSDVDVVGRPELQIETVGRTGVVAVGDRLTSKIQLKNHGSAPARNVGLSIRLPRELKLVEVRGGKYSVSNNVITFDAIPNISPKEAAAYELVMEAVAEADAQMNLEISADHLTRPARRSDTIQIAAEIN